MSKLSGDEKLINYAEILVANGTGVAVLFILLLFRFRNREQKRPAICMI